MFKLYKSTQIKPKIVTYNAGLFPVANGDYLVYRNGNHVSLYASLILCYKGKKIAEIYNEGHDYRNPALASDGTVFFMDATGLYLDGILTKNQNSNCKLMSYKNGEIKTIEESKDNYISPYGKVYIKDNTYVISGYDNYSNFILLIKNNKIISSKEKSYVSLFNESAIFEYKNKWYGLARKGDLGTWLISYTLKKEIRQITNLDHPADITKYKNEYIAVIGGRSGLHGNIRVFKGKNPLTMWYNETGWDNETDYYLGEFDDFGYPTLHNNTVYFYGRHKRFGYLLFSFEV